MPINVKDAAGTTVSVETPNPNGRAAAASSRSIALSTEDKAVLDLLATAALQGSLTEPAPATDTASSGLNGRLQRIAQRITSLMNFLPAALGAGGGIKVDGSGTALPVAAGAATSGGLTTYHLQSAATTNASNVKSSPGQLYGVQATNKSTTSAAYVRLFNKASAPTVGTDTPVKTITLPAASSAIQPTVVIFQQPIGIVFPTGIAFAITGGSADLDATAVAAGDVILEIDFK